MSTNDSPIEWTDATWNVVRGCSRVSAGCERCYAERQANRFKGKGQPYEGLVRLSKKGPVWTGRVRLVADQLDVPLRWRKPKKIFVNSMSDLFHESLTNEEIAAVFGVMAASPQHTFQILTKRAKRMREWFAWIGDRNASLPTPRNRCFFSAARHLPDFEKNHGFMSEWPLPNVWLGVSVENQQYADERIPELLRTPATVRFVSAEPLLGPITFEDSWAGSGPGLDWVICGGESGSKARPMERAWAESLRDRCAAASIAFFMKQMGRWVLGNHDGFLVQRWLFADGRGWVLPIIGENAKKRPENAIGFGLCDGHGGELEHWPEALRVRQFPTTIARSE